MGTSAEHVAKWRHNRDFLRTIPDRYCDWLAVTAFYTAVHAVESLFVRDNVNHEGSHKGRNQILKSRPRYNTTIWKHFHPLFNAGWVARYHCDVAETSNAWVSVDDVKQRLIGENLYEIEKLIAKLLSLPAKDFPTIFPATTAPT